MAVDRITIPASRSNDRFYRYKRDRLTIATHKNGTVTELTNAAKVVRSLSTKRVDDVELARRLKHLTSWLKRTLAVGGKCIDTITLQGALSVDEIERVFEVYIEQVYLCRMCRLPEVDHAARHCAACGGKN